jgi:ABC-2 type transport system ATP-binding protein
MGIIERYCDRALFLEKGKVRHMGSPNEIARMYEEMFLDEEVTKRAEKRSKRTGKDQDEYKDDVVSMSKVRTVQSGRTTDTIRALKEFEIQVDFTSSKDIEKAIARMNIKNRRGFVVVASDSDSLPNGLSLKKGVKQTLSFKIDNTLTNDIYAINISFSDISTSTEIGLTQKRPVSEFSVKGIEKYPDSITHPSVIATIS